MKCTLVSTVGIALLASNVAAFPRAAMEALSPEALEKLMKPREIVQKRDTTPPQGAGALPVTPPPFDAASQFVSTSGDHAFIAPGATDERGPCPGLNALANHGYLPRNGKASIAQLIDATGEVFGMGFDLATFLAVFGAALDGDGLGWSIGGTRGTGISGSHGNYETDNSPFKGDLNQYGSNGELILSQFQNFLNRQPNDDTANYNLEVLRDFRGYRFQESVQKNPWFSYQVFTGTLVSQAAFTFIYRFMSNKTAEAPEGILNRKTLMSFNAVTESNGKLTWNPGHERIPDNWYGRNTLASYSIPYFLADVLYLAEQHPEILSLGCNTGTVNSYLKLDPAILTNNAAGAKELLSDPVCFAVAYAQFQVPNLLGPALTLPILSELNSALSNVTKQLNCGITINSINQTTLAVCPGFTFYGGPTGPVAPGAIQS